MSLGSTLRTRAIRSAAKFAPAIACLLSASVSAYQGNRDSGTAGAPTPDVLNQYCAGCHNAANPTAGFALNSLDAASVRRSQTIWNEHWEQRNHSFHRHRAGLRRRTIESAEPGCKTNRILGDL